MKGQHNENLFFVEEFFIVISPKSAQKMQTKACKNINSVLFSPFDLWVFSERHYSFVRSSFLIMCWGSYEFPKDSEKRRDYFLWNITFITFEVYPEVMKENLRRHHSYTMKGACPFYIQTSWEISQSDEGPVLHNRWIKN